MSVHGRRPVAARDARRDGARRAASSTRRSSATRRSSSGRSPRSRLGIYRPRRAGQRLHRRPLVHRRRDPRPAPARARDRPRGAHRAPRPRRRTSAPTSRRPRVYVRADPAHVEEVQAVLGATANPERPEAVNVARPSDAIEAQGRRGDRVHGAVPRARRGRARRRGAGDRERDAHGDPRAPLGDRAPPGARGDQGRDRGPVLRRGAAARGARRGARRHGGAGDRRRLRHEPGLARRGLAAGDRDRHRGDGGRRLRSRGCTRRCGPRTSPRRTRSGQRDAPRRRGPRPAAAPRRPPRPGARRRSGGGRRGAGSLVAASRRARRFAALPGAGRHDEHLAGRRDEPRMDRHALHVGLDMRRRGDGRDVRAGSQTAEPGNTDRTWPSGPTPSQTRSNAGSPSGAGRHERRELDRVGRRGAHDPRPAADRHRHRDRVEVARRDVDAQPRLADVGVVAPMSESSPPLSSRICSSGRTLDNGWSVGTNRSSPHQTWTRPQSSASRSGGSPRWR